MNGYKRKKFLKSRFIKNQESLKIFKYVFCTEGKISVRINLPLYSKSVCIYIGIKYKKVIYNHIHAYISLCRMLAGLSRR